MKCLVCFESATAIGPNGYFVATKNRHIFHYSCALSMIAAGTPWCPLCDEDLGTHVFVRLSNNNEGLPHSVPPRPPPPQLTPSASVASTSTGNGQRSITRNPDTANRAPNGVYANLPQQRVSFQVQPDHVFKIVMLGSANVGKSSLIQRYADERFAPHSMPTTGCDLRVKTIAIGGKLVRLNIWDTAGQERHFSLVSSYLRRADGIIFCFDITDATSFASLQAWYEFAYKTVSNDTVKILVGNKSDLWSQGVIDSAQVVSLAEYWNCQFLYASAKDATNVEAIFRSVAAFILEKRTPSVMTSVTPPGVTGTSPSAPPIMTGAPRQQRQSRSPPVNPHYNNGSGGSTIRLTNSEKAKKKKKQSDCC